jgi:uncharacterized membrane protein required for colicin V production
MIDTIFNIIIITAGVGLGLLTGVLVLSFVAFLLDLIEENRR